MGLISKLANSKAVRIASVLMGPAQIIIPTFPMLCPPAIARELGISKEDYIDRNSKRLFLAFQRWENGKTGNCYELTAEELKDLEFLAKNEAKRRFKEGDTNRNNFIFQEEYIKTLPKGRSINEIVEENEDSINRIFEEKVKRFHINGIENPKEKKYQEDFFYKLSITQFINKVKESDVDGDYYLTKADSIINGKYNQLFFTRIFNKNLNKEIPIWEYDSNIINRMKEIVPISSPYLDMIVDECKDDKKLISIMAAIIYAESYYDPYIISKKGAKGLTQLMDATAEEMGVENVFDPRENIRGGTKYIKGLLKRYDNNLIYSLSAYNAGPTKVNEWIKKGWKGTPEEVSKIPFSETQDYVVKICTLLDRLYK